MNKLANVFVSRYNRLQKIDSYLFSIPRWFWTLTILCAITIPALEYGWLSNKPPLVSIGLQIAYATLASLLFYALTVLLPLHTKRLKCYHIIQNSTSHILTDIDDYFSALAKENTSGLPESFYSYFNLKEVLELSDENENIWYGRSKMPFMTRL